MTSAMRSASSMSSAEMRRRAFARSVATRFDHSGNAFDAASTAAFASAVPASAATPTRSPVAGSRTGNDRSTTIHSPPINSLPSNAPPPRRKSSAIPSVALDRGHALVGEDLGPALEELLGCLLSSTADRIGIHGEDLPAVDQQSAVHPHVVDVQATRGEHEVGGDVEVLAVQEGCRVQPPKIDRHDVCPFPRLQRPG